ncbi:DUF2510 domain-containing protein [Streptomyces sp. NPDC059009]|uniref:DUF2510 domain-containing protein n=1 Tax=Streptomyces sp. NPDC059009 TaxID=3346694 RepID=UPI0036CE4F00
MTQATPPGWYPDPGQTSDGPRTERWWDGQTWTDQVRSAAGGPMSGAPGAGHPAGPPVHPGYPGLPVAPPGGRRRGARIAIAAIVGVAVLAGIGGGVYALTADDDGDGGRGDSAKPPRSSAPSAPGEDGGNGGQGGNGGGGSPEGPNAPEQSPGGPSQGPEPEKGFVADPTNGISLPTPDGWRGGATDKGAAVTTAPFPCPGNASEQCTRGGAYSAPATAYKIDAKSAKAAARADIAPNAKDAFGGKTYGKITSHKELESKAVTVAGQKGYLVRWKVVTQKSDDGYVQSLAFPSPVDKDRIVIVRFGLDINDEAPKQSVLDEITQGIKKAPDGAGGGNGTEV